MKQLESEVFQLTINLQGDFNNGLIFRMKLLFCILSKYSVVPVISSLVFHMHFLHAFCNTSETELSKYTRYPIISEVSERYVMRDLFISVVVAQRSQARMPPEHPLEQSSCTFVYLPETVAVIGVHFAL